MLTVDSPEQTQSPLLCRQSASEGQDSQVQAD
jgi:hypothetical protein